MLSTSLTQEGNECFGSLKGNPMVDVGEMMIVIFDADEREGIASEVSTI